MTKLEAIQTQEASLAGGREIYSIFGGQLKAKGKTEAEAFIPFITTESTLKQMKQPSQKNKSGSDLLKKRSSGGPCHA